ncbi:MAG: winged helix-turn-helix domain-containing protein [Shewanella sp.]
MEKKRVENQAKTKVEMRVKTPDLILGVLAVEPTLTLKQVAERIGKSTSTVERATSALVKEGRLRFAGPRKVDIGKCCRRKVNNSPNWLALRYLIKPSEHVVAGRRA